MKKELTIGLLTVALTIGLASTVTAQQSQDTNVDVNISGVTQLDVRPSSLAYTDDGDGSSLEPGQERSISDGGYEHIEVENIGSERIGNIYAQATMPTEQPFGTYSSSDTDTPHNTGNFVTLSLETAQNGYGFSGELASVTTPHHLNRVEYFEDNPPTYITTQDSGDVEETDGAGTFDVEAVDVGRIKVGGAEYFFAWYEDQDGSNTALRIGNTPHTSTVLGTTDFSNEGSDYTEYYDPDDAGPSDVYQMTNQDLVSFDTTESGNFDGDPLISDGSALDGDGEAANSSVLNGAETRNYALYLDSGNDLLIRNRFNIQQESPEFDSDADQWSLSDTSGDTSQTYILDAGTEDEALQPGQNFPINFGVQVPLGVDQNAIDEGTVTVISETFSD